jgi:hypothetical protein
MFFDVLRCAVVLLLFYKTCKWFSISFVKNMNYLPKKITKEMESKKDAGYRAKQNGAGN